MTAELHTSFDAAGGRQFCTGCVHTELHYGCLSLNEDDSILSDAVLYTLQQDPLQGRNFILALEYYRQKSAQIIYPKELIQQYNDVLTDTIKQLSVLNEQKGKTLEHVLTKYGFDYTKGN